MLTIKQCSKSFRRTKALDRLSADFGKGVYGLLGPNGSGKTTLMRCICGIISPESGEIINAADRIGYLPQKFGMMKQLTVYEMMAYFATLLNIPKEKQRPEIERCINEVNLSDKILEKVGALSGGMVRRVGIAQAIMGDPDILLFDEPTTGLDPEERMRFKTMVSRIGTRKTTIISTHIVSDVEAVCDQIMIIDQGRLVTEGSGREIAALAQGKAYLVDGQYEHKLTGSYYLKDRIEDQGKTFLYVLSDNPQEGKTIPPTIEDGYLCALKKF